MHDISRLDIKLLLAFDALMEERSVTRAARRLHVTQQGVSGMLQRLRDLFDDPLFVREARGVAPTPRAEALAARIKSAIAVLEGVLDHPGFDPATAEGTAYVAASDYAASTIVAPLFQRIRTLAPKVRVGVLPITAITLSNETHGARVDLALTILAFKPKNWFQRELLEEHYLCAVRADHPLAGKTVDLDAFCDCEHLLIAPYRADFKGLVDNALERVGRTRRIGLSIPSFANAGSVLERTDLLAVLPIRILNNMNQQLFLFPPPVEINPSKIIATWPERVHDDPLHRWFRQLCFDTSQVIQIAD